MIWITLITSEEFVFLMKDMDEIQLNHFEVAMREGKLNLRLGIRNNSIQLIELRKTDADAKPAAGSVTDA